MFLCWTWGWPGIGFSLKNGAIGPRNWGRFLPEAAQGTESERKPHQCSLELGHSKSRPWTDQWLYHHLGACWSYRLSEPTQTPGVRICSFTWFLEAVKFEVLPLGLLCQKMEFMLNIWDFSVQNHIEITNSKASSNYYIKLPGITQGHPYSSLRGGRCSQGHRQDGHVTHIFP